MWLPPTFDPGASMARNLTDRERLARLETGDINRQMPAFARKARSAFYDQPTDNRPMTTMAAWRAFGARRPDAAATWLKRLEAVQDSDVQDLLQQIPERRISDVCRRFTMRLLQENRRRLLTGDET